MNKILVFIILLLVLFVGIFAVQKLVNKRNLMTTNPAPSSLYSTQTKVEDELSDFDSTFDTLSLEDDDSDLTNLP